MSADKPLADRIAALPDDERAILETLLDRWLATST